MSESLSLPPFERIDPKKQALPAILSVPHAGRAYSQDLLKSVRVPREALETLEDPLVDQLVEHAASLGCIRIIANAPRVEIDLNRDERELDSAIIAPSPELRATVLSPQAMSGLGVIPSRISGAGPIWLRRIAASEIARRIETIHRPYHTAIEQAVEETRKRFGIVILLDCHSMPPRKAGPDVIFGDRHGTSSAPTYVEAAQQAAESAGYRTGRNAPYAGGYITARHGRPAKRVHAIQLEIDRALYLDARLKEPGPGFKAVASMISAVVETISRAALDAPEAIAAE